MEVPMSDDQNNPPVEDAMMSWGARRLTMLALALALANIFLQSIVFSTSRDMFLAVALGALGVVIMSRTVAMGAGIAPSRLIFAARPNGHELLLAAIVSVTALVPTSLLAGISTQLRPPSEQWIQFYNDNLPNGTLPTIIAFAAVVIFAPVAEEIVFRGLLFRACRRHWGLLPSALVTGLVFALSHGEPWALFGLIPLGILFALITEATGSIVPAIVAHGIHNALSFSFMLANGGLVMPENEESIPWVWLIVSLVGLGAVLLRLFQTSKPKFD
jgi:membrane protease YdiL (CAAX protease family)